VPAAFASGSRLVVDDLRPRNLHDTRPNWPAPIRCARGRVEGELRPGVRSRPLEAPATFRVLVGSQASRMCPLGTLSSPAPPPTSSTHCGRLEAQSRLRNLWHCSHSSGHLSRRGARTRTAHCSSVRHRGRLHCDNSHTPNSCASTNPPALNLVLNSASRTYDC